MHLNALYCVLNCFYIEIIATCMMTVDSYIEYNPIGFRTIIELQIYTHMHSTSKSSKICHTQLTSLAMWYCTYMFSKGMGNLPGKLFLNFNSYPWQ